MMSNKEALLIMSINMGKLLKDFFINGYLPYYKKILLTKFIKNKIWILIQIQIIFYNCKSKLQ